MNLIGHIGTATTLSISAIILDNAKTQIDVTCRYLSPAFGLPTEPSARKIRRRQPRPPLVRTWARRGVFEWIWAALQVECAKPGDVKRKWQSADGCMNKARFGGEKIGPNPIDRGKPGTKKSILVEADGRPLAAVIDRANVHDCRLLKPTINAMAAELPEPEDVEQHLRLDKAFDNPTGEDAAEESGCITHIRRIGEEKKNLQGHKRKKARRWAVGRTLGWLQKCRALLVRYDKHWENFLALIRLACALL